MRKLKDCRVGDSVFSLADGWGVIKNIDIGTYPLIVFFEDFGYMSFNEDGKGYIRNKNPILFTERPDWYPKEKTAHYLVLFKYSGGRYNVSKGYYTDLEEFQEFNEDVTGISLIEDSKIMK